MTRTVLYDAQRDAGGRFTDVGDLEVAADYGDCLEEHHAVRRGVGLLDRSWRAMLVVRGADRFTWLQGMVSSDVRQLEAGERAQRACLLNATGHLLADLRVVNRPDSLVLDVPRQTVGRVLPVLEQYVIAEDVRIADESASLLCLSLQGPSASDSWVRERVGDAAFAVPADHTGEGGFDLYVDGGDAVALWAGLVRAGARPVGEAAADTLRIEAGIPRYGIDMDENTIPLECGLAESHISFAKGCYVGQEVIARIRSRGHTNRSLTGFLVEGSALPARGDKVYPTEGETTKEIGWATSAAHSPSLDRAVALGYVRNDCRERGREVRIVRNDEDDVVRASVADLPFYRAGSRPA